MYYSKVGTNLQLNPSSVKMSTPLASNKSRMIPDFFLSNKTHEAALGHLPKGFAPCRLSLPPVHSLSSYLYLFPFPLYVSDSARRYDCCLIGYRAWYLHLAIRKRSQQDTKYDVPTYIRLVNFAFIFCWSSRFVQEVIFSYMNSQLGVKLVTSLVT